MPYERPLLFNLEKGYQILTPLLRKGEVDFDNTQEIQSVTKRILRQLIAELQIQNQVTITPDILNDRIERTLVLTSADEFIELASTHNDFTICKKDKISNLKNQLLNSAGLFGSYEDTDSNQMIPTIFINLNPTIPRRSFEYTLLHECSHAADSISEIGLPYFDQLKASVDRKYALAACIAFVSISEFTGVILRDEILHQYHELARLFLSTTGAVSSLLFIYYSKLERVLYQVSPYELRANINANRVALLNTADSSFEQKE